MSAHIAKAYVKIVPSSRCSACSVDRSISSADAVDAIKARLDALDAADRSVFARRLSIVQEREELRRVEVDTRLSKLEDQLVEHRGEHERHPSPEVGVLAHARDCLVHADRAAEAFGQFLRRLGVAALDRGQQIVADRHLHDRFPFLRNRLARLTLRRRGDNDSRAGGRSVGTVPSPRPGRRGRGQR